MSDLLFGNNNKTIIRRITKRAFAADKKRNFFIIMAILLTAFMLTSVFSIGMSYYETIAMREQRMEGSTSQMAFAKPTEEQLAKIYTLDYIKTVGIGASVAVTDAIPGFKEMSIAYVDKSQWEDMFSPTYTNIVGHYPDQENEIMLSRYLLNALEIENAEIGMKIPLSYTVDGESFTADFILSCVYTEYSHLRPGGDINIYCSEVFAENYGAHHPENLTVNVIFKDADVAKNIEKLKSDLSFYADQPYIQSPAFQDRHKRIINNFALALLVLFLMLTGYLLIYNVMYISVTKDVRFFGMLKTIGTTPKQIRHIVTIQVVYLCLIGLPIGCLMGAAVSLLVVPAIISNSGIETGAIVSFSPLIYMCSIFFTLVTALLGAMTPAKKAARVSPIEALHYTGEPLSVMPIRNPIKGKLIHMAWRNISRDRKRAVIVILSLFLSITVFTSVMTLLNSIDADHYIHSEYDYDFFFTANMGSHYFLDDGFVESVKQYRGVKEAATVKIGSVELRASESLMAYAEQVAKKLNQSVDTIVVDGAFYNAHTLKGIDPLSFDTLNKTLPSPIDPERFERGEVAIINVTDASLVDAFDGISRVEIKRESDRDYQAISVGGTIQMPPTQADQSFQYSEVEVLVSNDFLDRYIQEPQLLSLGLNVENDDEETLYDTFKSLSSENDVSMVSRYEGRQSIQDAKTIMGVLGGGISFILGFIGIFNFINVMSVGVMSRKHELASLETIGMTKRQLRAMLRHEGFGYALVTLSFAATLGNLISFGSFKLFQTISEYAVNIYPVMPVMSVYILVLAICLVTPEFAYHSISQQALVERLRQD